MFNLPDEDIEGVAFRHPDSIVFIIIALTIGTLDRLEYVKVSFFPDANVNIDPSLSRLN